MAMRWSAVNHTDRLSLRWRTARTVSTMTPTNCQCRPSSSSLFGCRSFVVVVEYLPLSAVVVRPSPPTALQSAARRVAQSVPRSNTRARVGRVGVPTRADASPSVCRFRRPTTRPGSWRDDCTVPPRTRSPTPSHPTTKCRSTDDDDRDESLRERHDEPRLTGRQRCSYCCERHQPTANVIVDGEGVGEKTVKMA